MIYLVLQLYYDEKRLDISWIGVHKYLNKKIEVMQFTKRILYLTLEDICIPEN